MTSEIKLLPVNSYELERLLTDVGLSLLNFAKEFEFSEKCVGVKDCDFIQCVIIEFISDIKIDFIAYHSVHVARTSGVQSANIISDEHDHNAMIETAIHARQAGIRINNIKFNVLSQTRYAACRLAKRVVHQLYQRRVKQIRKGMSTSVEPPKSGQFKVLMSTFHPSTVSTLIPIQDKLSERADVHQLYIANRHETYSKLRSLGYKNIASFWSLGDADVFDISSPALKIFVDNYFDQYFPFGKATPHFISVFYKKLKAKLKFAASLYGPLAKVMNGYDPDCVVLSSSSPIDAQVIVHLAQTNRVKVIEITHGIFQETPILKFQNIPVKLVWNQYQIDLMRVFKPETRCILVGNPKHDMLLKNFANNPPPKIFDRPYILFATTPGNTNSITWTTYLRILKDFVDAAVLEPTKLFVVKLHPSESLEKIEAKCTEFGSPKNLIVEKESDIYQLLFHAEAVMVVTSTVGYEALLLNKRLIIYAIDNGEKWLPFSKYNLATRVESAGEIANSVREFERLPSPNFDESKSNFVYSDGKAICKTVDIILNQ